MNGTSVTAMSPAEVQKPQEDSRTLTPAIGATNVAADEKEVSKVSDEDLAIRLEQQDENNEVAQRQPEDANGEDSAGEQDVENQAEQDENHATIGLLRGQHAQLGTHTSATALRRVRPRRRRHQQRLAVEEEQRNAIPAVLVDDSAEFEEARVPAASAKVVSDAEVIEDKPSPSKWFCVVGLAIAAIVAVSIIVPLATKQRTTTDPTSLKPNIHPTELLENRNYTYHVAYLASQTTCSDQLSVLVECEDGKIRDFPPDIGCLRNEEDEDDRGVVCLLETNKAYSIHFGCSWESGGKGGLKEAATASLTLLQSTTQSSSCSDNVIFNVARYCKEDLLFSPCLSSDPVVTNKNDTACAFKNRWLDFNECFLAFCPKATDVNLGREICNEEQARPDEFLDVMEEYDFEAWSAEWLATQLN